MRTAGLRRRMRLVRVLQAREKSAGVALAARRRECEADMRTLGLGYDSADARQDLLLSALEREILRCDEQLKSVEVEMRHLSEQRARTRALEQALDRRHASVLPDHDARDFGHDTTTAERPHRHAGLQGAFGSPSLKARIGMRTRRQRQP